MYTGVEQEVLQPRPGPHHPGHRLAGRGQNYDLHLIHHIFYIYYVYQCHFIYACVLITYRLHVLYNIYIHPCIIHIQVRDIASKYQHRCDKTKVLPSSFWNKARADAAASDKARLVLGHCIRVIYETIVVYVCIM